MRRRPANSLHHSSVVVPTRRRAAHLSEITIQDSQYSTISLIAEFEAFGLR